MGEKSRTAPSAPGSFSNCIMITVCWVPSIWRRWAIRCAKAAASAL